MNDCNGNGVCGDNGQCTCKSGYKLADCSLKSYVAYYWYKVFSFKGPKYFSFSVNEAGILSFESEVPFDIYITRGDSDPTQFSNDMAFKSMTGTIEIDSRNYTILKDGYTALVYMQAVDEVANELITGTLSSTFSNPYGASAIEQVINQSLQDSMF